MPALRPALRVLERQCIPGKEFVGDVRESNQDTGIFRDRLEPDPAPLHVHQRVRLVQRLLREQGVRFVQSVWQPGAPQPATPLLEDPAELPAATGRGADEAPSLPPPAGLAREDAQKLQAALRELGECRRILDAVLNDQSQGRGS